VALWMWRTMSNNGGLGKEETQGFTSGKRVADN